MAVKEELLVEAEKLVPVKDLGAAKKALRSIQDRWDKAGRVPRNDVRRIEARLKKVEDEIRSSESTKWKTKNPELQGRANDTVTRFREAVEKRERALQRAKDAGDAGAISKAESELDGAKAMLAVAEQASQKLN